MHRSRHFASYMKSQWDVRRHLRFCGIYMALAEDIEGHARLVRGHIILTVLKETTLCGFEGLVWETFECLFSSVTRGNSAYSTSQP